MVRITPNRAIIVGAACLAAVLSACAAAPGSTKAGRDLDPHPSTEGETHVWPTAQWDVQPRRLSGKAPIFPVSRLLAGKGGQVVLELTIGTDGRARDFKVVSADDRRFADHAIIAMEQWRFAPARKDGKPVEARITQSFDFGVR